MAKRTLLDMVQEILTVMESDEINSIGDTAESEEVAAILRTTYFDMHSNRNWPSKKSLVQLVPFTDLDKPTHMSIQDDFTEMLGINYNKTKAEDPGRKRYESVDWKEPDDFLRYTNSRNNEEANVLAVVDPTGVELLILNDKAPTYYTSFNDKDIIFDSYDSAVDTTLQASKVQAMAYLFPIFTIDDDFIPDMPVDAFSGYLAEARSRCQYWLKDFSDQKSEQEAGRQSRWLSRKAWTVNGGIKFPNYGRRARKGYSDPTFQQRKIRDT